MAGSPKITILSEQHRGKTFELTKDLYTVGRIEERDICIPDPTISTYHGSFVKSGSTYILKDNNSTNGSRVNNEPIVEQELKNSDIIQLGDVEMLYDCEEKDAVGKTSNITGISLTVSPTSSSSIKKIDPISPYGEKNKNNSKKSQKAILIVIGVLVLIVLGLLGLLVSKMM
ncbi:MAG: FHA domain-containing protein [Lentisphaeria bacterium]|nr:FHA domain-containing protein [Lentisphaeria bacterium]